MASEAATPSTTASIVVHSATLKLLAAAKCSCQASISAAYQRSEYPGGGNFSEKPDVNETMITTSVGSISSRKHEAASPHMTNLKLSASRLLRWRVMAKPHACA